MSLAKDGMLPSALRDIDPTLDSFIRNKARHGRYILNEWGLIRQQVRRTESDQKETAMRLAKGGVLPNGLRKLDNSLLIFIWTQEKKGRDVLKEWGIKREQATRSEEDHRRAAMKLAVESKLPAGLRRIDPALAQFIYTQENKGRDILKEWGWSGRGHIKQKVTISGRP